MPNLTSNLIVKLLDGVSGPARVAAQAIRGIGAAVRSVNGAGLAAVQTRLGIAIAANNQHLALMQNRLFAVAAGAYGLKRALQPVIGDAADFETVMEGLGQKVDISGQALRDIGSRIKQVGRETNQSTMNVARGVDFLVGMGLGGKTNADDVAAAIGMAPAIGKTASAYRANFEDIARSSHAVFQNLGVDVGHIQLALDAMAKAGKEGGYELENMAKDFPGITAAAQFVGEKGVPAVADLAAALQVARKGAQDGATAANNLMNFFQKFTLKETVTNFKKLGVDIYKELDFARKKGISPIEHMMYVIRKITNGNSDLISKLFADKQVLEFIRPMWANMDEYRRIRQEALHAPGTVVTDFERRMKTAQAVFDRFNNSLENMRINLGTALLPGLTALLDRIEPIISAFSRWAEQNPALARTLVALAAGLVSVRVAMLGLGIVWRLAYGGLLSVAYGAVVALRALTWLNRGLLLGPLIRAFAALRAGMVWFIASSAIIGFGPTLAMVGSSLLGLLNPLRLVRAALVAMRVALISSGIGAVLVAIAMAGLWIYNNWAGIKELFAGIADGFAKGLGPAADYLRPVAELAVKLFDAIDGLLGPLSASKDEWRSWGETIGGTVAAGVNAVAAGIRAVIGLFESAYQGAVALGNAVSNLWHPGGTNPNPRAAKPVTVQPRASGGSVRSGHPYLVGEKRAELFVPGRSGTIVPDPGKMGSTVNLSPVFNFTGQHNAAEIAAAVRAVMRDEVSRMFRGVQADVGMEMA